VEAFSIVDDRGLGLTGGERRGEEGRGRGVLMAGSLISALPLRQTAASADFVAVCGLRPSPLNLNPGVGSRLGGNWRRALQP
jgi:hypothetical protein